MKFIHTFLSLTILTLLFPTLALAGAPSTQSVMSIDGQKIGNSVYEGQTIDWVVTLIDAEPVKPKVEMNDDFQIFDRGDHPQNSTSIIIVNGKRIDNSQRKHIYTFQLVSNKTGELQLPKLVFETEGRQLTAGGGTLTVKSADAQDVIIMKILAQSNGKDVSESPLYPMQSFDVVLRIWIKAIPEPNSDHNPLTVQQTPVRLKIPWAMDNLPDGLATPSDVSVWLGPYQNNSGGFSINDYKKAMSAFDLMDDFDFGFGSVSRRPSLFTFMPKAKAVTLPDANGTETKYWQFDFVRRFTAQKTGSYQFGPVNFQGDLAVGFENGRLQGEAFFANAKALTVNVVPPPEKGRPDDYINAVGLFDMTASATPDKVKVGDPITLTLRVRGSGSFEDMTAPKLESIPAFADNFKIYESTDKLTDGQMEFSWSMRPLNDKVREIPAITASFFNVDTGQYFQMKTNPIPLTVEKGSTLLMSTPSVPNAGAGSSDQNWKTSQGGVHANVTDVNQLRESPFNLMKSPAAFIWTNGIVYGAFIALSALILLVRMMKSSPVQVRRRHAAANALSAIRQAKSLNTPADRLDAVVKAITSYAADRQNVPAAGLTTDDVIRLLRQDGCNDESVLNDARSILQMADAARFGGLDVNVNVPEKAEKIIMKLREFKSSPRVRAAQFVLLAALVTFSGCSQPLSSDEVKQFQKGLDEFAQAQKPDDYLNSAQTYLNLVNQGVKSGAVYYNLGNAYAMAGDKPRALAAYRQAVPYMPSNPHLLDNIQSVGGKEQAVPLFENLFFWQNWISLPNKAFIATILSVLTTLTLLAYLIFGKRPILYVGIVFVLLTVCSFVSVQYDYQRFVQTQHGVVTASKVVARKGDADTYAPALTQPLTAGVEFTVSQKRGDWLLINLDDSHEGWIPASSAIVY